ncbi:MAG: nucleotidyl transferase AbiEii/AbiGii toxin family protein [Candidatus Aminicenantes bacterium]|nr:nucleotidyl transferase AbiEii/AbiGii toxin family protein [Candidatus Aminicenantes bacterium]
MPEINIKASMPQNTREVFETLSGVRYLKKTLLEYTLVGGTALSIYLKHRMSEDLDFFKNGTSLDKGKLFAFFRKNGIKYEILAEPSSEQIDFLLGKVKISFFASGFDCLKNKKNKKYGNIEIASVELITAMKVYTLSLRSEFRDYYDLYVLNKELYSIDEMFGISKDILHMGTFKLFSQQLVYIDDIKEKGIDQHLEPKYIVSLTDIREHFVKEIEKKIKKLR